MKTRITVRNCPVEFRFLCSQRWEDLAATDRPEIRHCDRCDQDVVFCTTDEETIAHARAGHCIARECPDASELPVVHLGRPATARPLEVTPSQAEASRRRSREGGIDDAIRNAGRSPRCCPECSYPAPAWRTTCRVCGFAIGRFRA